MPKYIKRKFVLLLACMIIISILSACNNYRIGGGNAKPFPGKIEAISLAIVGYNYTDRYINDFSVNGNGGGNLHVSGPSGGGGGSTCCATYVSGDLATKVRVEWQVGGCTYDNSVNDDGSLVYSIHPYYKEVEVQIDPKIPSDPKYLEVHFYPDGHIEAAVTENRSAPRLVLEKNRENKTSRLVTCPNGRRPQSNAGDQTQVLVQGRESIGSQLFREQVGATDFIGVKKDVRVKVWTSAPADASALGCKDKSGFACNV